MLSQFSKEAEHHITLKDLDFNFEKDVYPIGRLDYDSEGLLLLSNESGWNKKILSPDNKQPKTYWVQVEGNPSHLDLEKIERGIVLNIKGKKYKTLPCKTTILHSPNNIPVRTPPIRVRKNIPDTWVSITIVEGKNRQVRKMFAAIGFPVLRLIRVGIAGYKFGTGIAMNLQPGDVIKVS